MSCPSTVDTAPPHIVVEMQMMRERMDFMMNVLKGRVSNDLNNLVHRTDLLFTMFANSFPLPLKFRMSQVENYDGNKDPLDHLESFKTLMHLLGVDHVQSLPHHAEGPHKDLVQQADAQLD